MICTTNQMYTTIYTQDYKNPNKNKKSNETQKESCIRLSKPKNPVEKFIKNS